MQIKINIQVRKRDPERERLGLDNVGTEHFAPAIVNTEHIMVVHEEDPDENGTPLIGMEMADGSALIGDISLEKYCEALDMPPPIGYLDLTKESEK